MRRLTLTVIAILALAGPAQAQFFPRRPPPQIEPPPGTPPAEAAVWPYPAPDPKAWWDEAWPKTPETADPLGRRRLGRGEQLAPIDNGVDASTYRLWGLMPLQWLIIRGDEMILEVWTRPARSVRQSVVRVIVRRDGHAFVQARAGYACCEALIGRRMGFDAELPAGSAQALLALRNHPMWTAPRDVRVDEGGGTSEAVCLEGTAYDLTLLLPGRSRSLRRACDNAEIGQVADALEPVLGAALGHDPRFDVIYPGGASYAAARAAYRDLIAEGGQLKPDTSARPQPPGAAPDLADEPATPPAEAGPTPSRP
ncbi:MAG: hypothetical protein ABW360_04030 [Phenylobacterium sp.]